MIPRKKSLVHQVAAILRDGIRSGLWSDWLPGERALCETYKVSRNTVRAAINRLETEGFLEAVHGTGTRIIGIPEVTIEPGRTGVVGLITSRSIEETRPTTAIWLDELRARLFQSGLRLKIHEGRQYFREHPERGLELLQRQYNHSCWLLQQSTKRMQQWFSENRIPCAVAGSAYPGIALPSVDIDYQALCRHAVGLMIGRGHRRICMLTPASRRAGDLKGENGFNEGMETSPHHHLEGRIVRHGNGIRDVSAAIERILETDKRPTAILVARSYVYLTLVSQMAQIGMRVPNDISVVCREADPFFQFLTPNPSHYYADPIIYARKLVGTVLNVIDGDILRDSQSLTLPEFAAGESLEGPSEEYAA